MIRINAESKHPHALIKNTILFMLTALFIFIQSLAFAHSVNKHFSDYINITPTRTSDPTICRIHYFAKQKVNDRAHHPLYKNNQWKLVMRQGIFLAQVDKTMSEVYQYFLGYATDEDIVEDNGNIFIARRKFKSFKKAYKAERKLPNYIHRDGDKYFVNDFNLLADGRLIKDNQVKRMRGLASMAALTSFFGEADASQFNYGFQESDGEIKAIFYDSENAFEFAETENRIENELASYLGDAFIKMPWYQQEKKAMLQKIAATDFAIIEKIVRKYITSSRLDHNRWRYKKMLNDPTVWPEFDRAKAKKLLDEINQLDDKDYGIEKIIRELRTRHEKLRKQLASSMA